MIEHSLIVEDLYKAFAALKTLLLRSQYLDRPLDLFEDLEHILSVRLPVHECADVLDVRLESCATLQLLYLYLMRLEVGPYWLEENIGWAVPLQSGSQGIGVRGCTRTTLSRRELEVFRILLIKTEV